MHISILPLLTLSLLALTTTALPSAEPHFSDPLILALRSLPEDSAKIRFLARHITNAARHMHDKRFALAMPRGGGGGGGGGMKGAGSATEKAGKGADQGGSGGAQGVANPPPTGMSADGQKAWLACRAQSNQGGDCDAMKGPFAATGCYMAKASRPQPCENGEVQKELNRVMCAQNPTGPAARFCPKA